MKDYAAIATQYARDVADGRLLACKWVRLACARHLSDLAKAEAGGRWVWNPELRLRDGRGYRPADRVCHFAELMPHIKGDWASRGERIRLAPWQVFFLASVFGWIDRESGEHRTYAIDSESGEHVPLEDDAQGWFSARRRYREADLFVPRKNGKSAIAAVIGNYMLAADEEYGAEVYSGATSEKQAGEVFVPARLMAERTPEFRQRFGVQTLTSVISVPATNSKFERVIGKPGDGASPSCAIVDEYHEHQDATLYETMRTGMGARSQPLMLVITTAGDDVAGPCYLHQVELQQILDGIVENERRFGIIFTVDVLANGEYEDWTTEEALIKANPNFGVSIDPEFLQIQQRDATRDARKQATFLTKHLNIWINSASPWLNLHAWQKATDKTLSEDQFVGCPVFRGCDLANTTDIASTVNWFRRVEADGREHHYLFWKHYLPQQAIENPDHKHYQGWKREGWIRETPGGMIDQDQIEQDILRDDERFVTQEDALDGWGSAGFSATLQNAGHQVVLIPMNVQHLSPAMKWIEGLLEDGRLHHNGDPVALWGVANVIVKPDHNDNIFPRRQSRAKKIDPALAMIICAERVRLAQPPGGSLADFLNDPVTA